MAKTRTRITTPPTRAAVRRPRGQGRGRARQPQGGVRAARDVYDELLGNRGVTTTATRVATDKDIQDNLRKAVDELRNAADRVQGKDGHTGRNTCCC